MDVSRTNRLRVLALAILATGLGVWYYFASRGQPPINQAAQSALEIAPDNLTVGRLRGSLKILANIFPQVPDLQGLTRAQARQVLTKTAAALATRYLQKEEFRSLSYATVSLVGITSRNEYGDRDLRSLRNYAVVKLRRTEDGVPEVVSARVAFDPNTEVAVYQASSFARTAKSELPKSSSPVVEQPPAPLASVAEVWPAEVSEEVLFDETDLYDHPQFAGDRYAPFAPERVRRNQCEYYLVSDGARSAPGSLGPRFGEIVFRGEFGSLMYLPRAVKYEGALALAFSYRKSHAKARCFIGFYTGANRRALLREGEHDAFPLREDTEWHRVVVPLSAFMVRSVTRSAGPVPPPSPAWDYLQYHQVGAGEIFGLELGLFGAETGGTLEFDRVALIRPAAPSDWLKGQVEPAIAGVKIQIGSPEERLESVSDAQGHFALRLPATWRRYEVFTRHNNIDYHPAQGRYFDRGSYLTPLRLELNNDAPVQFRGQKGTVYTYWAEDGKGTHYQPRIHHLHSGNPQKPQDYFTENATNSEGFFDRDRRAANPSKAYRILVTGECYAEGSQIDSQERLTAQLDAILRFRQDQPVEVIGMIQPTMSFMAAAPSIEKVGLTYRPNLILINVVVPDMLASLHLEFDAARWGYNPKHPRNTSFTLDAKTGVLRCIPYEANWALFVDKGPPRRDIDYFKEFGGVNWMKDPYRVDPAARPPFLTHTIELLADTLRHLNREAGKVGARVALLDSSHIVAKEWEENGVRYDTRAFHALLVEAAEKAGTFVVDGRQMLTQRSSARVAPKTGFTHQWQHDGHWSPGGHRLVAESTAQELERLGWTGKAPALKRGSGASEP